MPVFVRSRVRRRQVREAVVSRIVQRLLALVGESGSELSIEFVGDTRMRRLNRDYRRQDRSTDVLAFASREAGGPPSSMLGDVVVSLPMAERQARTLGHSVHEELIRLLIHGVLHVIGYDHERGGKEAQRMKRKEERLFATFKPLPKVVK